ncbi:MAG: Tungsten-containing aldehyde:ferredoxin oxidoreductase [Firmicutes bacterium]|nr:Tungsten-containing aldehyde:ferredoxin oxidoreductase [Bacillota bacterium]
MYRIIRIDLNEKRVQSEVCKPELDVIGGRALISKIMLEEIEPTCDPLGPRNKLIFAAGVLAGTTVSCVNRISIGGKSPLTGTIKESNAGGTTAYKMGRLGIRALVFEGIPRDDKLYILYVSEEKTELIEADGLEGMGVYDSAKELRRRFGDKVGIALIGPAGEKMRLASGIANTDNEGIPSRYSARGGLGAVMGSKKIKAVVIDDRNAKGPFIANEEQFRKVRDTISDIIINNEQIANSYTKFGTANLVNLTNSMGALPTRNFSTGSFEGAEEINGQKLYDLITERKGEGKPSHACMPGCLIRCSNVFPGEDGKTIVSPIEYETIGLLGSNCGIACLDTIGRLNYLCNDIGLDTIEIGGAIGVAMEAGVISFGDGEGAVNLLEEVKKDTYLGKLIASGATLTGKVLGVNRIPATKGQTLAAYDPRAIKGLGVTYATSTMGGDHTAGQTLRAPVDHRKPEGQVEASKNAQISNAIHDCIGTCFFVGGAIKGDLQLLGDLIGSMTGKPCRVEDMKELAKATLLREKQFNTRAGFNEGDDMLPEFFYYEENPATGTVFDVDREEMKLVHKFE